MKSRGKLLALIAVFTAFGLVTGTGAFSTVEAQRTADVNVAGDSSALLGLEAGNSVLIEKVDNQVTITLDSSNAAGVNQNATTAVNGTRFLNITNNGDSNAVEVDMEYSTASNVGVYFVVSEGDVTDGTPQSLHDLDLITDSETEIIDPTSKYPIRNNTVEIDSGESVDVGIVIDVGNVGSGTELIPGDITILADAR
jgi:hypothetical protein